MEARELRETLERSADLKAQIRVLEEKLETVQSENDQASDRQKAAIIAFSVLLPYAALEHATPILISDSEIVQVCKLCWHWGDIFTLAGRCVPEDTTSVEDF